MTQGFSHNRDQRFRSRIFDRDRPLNLLYDIISSGNTADGVALHNDSRGPVGDHGEYVAQINGEGLQVGVRQAAWLLLLQGFSVVIHVDDTILHLQLIVQVLRDVLHAVWVLPLTRAGADVCGGNTKGKTVDLQTNNTSFLLFIYNFKFNFKTEAFSTVISSEQ